MADAVPDFVHLHVHSEYSLLDGLAKLPALVADAGAQGMAALALTDHGVMHGALAFYQAARAAGIKPLVGLEAYQARERMDDRLPGPYHLTLLARDVGGYHHLVRMASKASLEGFYYKPRVDRDLLAGHHDGVVALSGCLGAEVPQLVLQGKEEEARAAIGWFRDVFGPEGYYLELQDHQLPEQRRVNTFLVAQGKALGVPLVCTNDVHYLRAADAAAHDVLLCVQTATTVGDPKRMRMSSQEFYLKSPAAMAALFPDQPEALRNTRRIADNSDLQLTFGRTELPEFPLPDGHTPDSYLRALVAERLGVRYARPDDALRRRVEYEVDVICRLGFAQYMLIVADFTSWARRRGIMAEPRGSVGGSVVAYIVGISDVDPIRFQLPFERFLSPERHEMPDIDLDFPDDRRGEVYEYVKEKYGADHVAQIITYNTMLGKTAIRDVGRALAMPLAAVDRVAKLLPDGVKVTIAQGLAASEELRALAAGDPAVATLLATAQTLEGLARNSSVHAAGVVISRPPLMEVVPIQRAKGGQGGAVTQYEAAALQALGLLKMDFLGLANFSNIDLAIQTIRETRGLDLDIKAIPEDDAATFALLQRGETYGIFQLESDGMRKYLKALRPTTIRDISAMISLYRPGPIANIPRYIAAKQGQAAARYPHPDLEPILAESYGVIVYQEQVMAIAVAIAGFTVEQGYAFIKAIAKKNAVLLQQNKEPFLAGTVAQGYSPALAEQLWALFEPFQRYSFNKAHTMGYAHITYRTAYLKAHFPREYMAAVLTSHIGVAEEVAAAVEECRRMRITVLPPCVNHSADRFAVEGGDIRFGLSAVKGIGGAGLAGLVAERRAGGPYVNVLDFCQRIDTHVLTKATLTGLVRSGALDALADRVALDRDIPRLIARSRDAQYRRERDDGGMFGREAVVATASREAVTQDPADRRQRLAWDQEYLGYYPGEHPVHSIAHQLQRHATVRADQLGPDLEGQVVTVAGILGRVRAATTKHGKPMVTATLDDAGGTLALVVFQAPLAADTALWQEDAPVVCTGPLSRRDGVWQVRCERAVALPAAQQVPERHRLEITIPPLPAHPASAVRLARLEALLRGAQGADHLTVRVRTAGHLTTLAGPLRTVAATPALLAQVQQLLGPGCCALHPLGPE